MKAEDVVNELHESDIFYEYIMNYFIGHDLSPEGVKAELHEFLSDIDPKHAEEIIDKLKIPKD